MMQTDRLLGPELADVDGRVEGRRGTISMFNGPEPTIMVCDAPEDGINAVSGVAFGTERGGSGAPV